MSWLAKAFGRLAEGAPRVPEQLRIPDENVSGVHPGRPFVAEEDYLIVEVNEFRLDYSRRLWQGFAPSVWVSTQLRYAGQLQSIPVVIGPSQLGSPENGDPQAQLYRNARVLGPAPYRGGVVGVSLVLSQVAADDKTTRLLQLIESVGSAFDLAVAITPYLRLGKAVTDGVGALLDLGTKPLMGVQDTINVDAGATGGWYALIDAPPRQPLWVIDGRLRTGNDRNSATPVTGCNYILYSVTALPPKQGRNDVASLPDLADQRALAEQFASRPDKRSWTVAKALYSELGLRLRNHPDVTRTQAEQLFGSWSEDLTRLHAHAVALANRGPAGRDVDQLDPDLSEIESIVDNVMKL